MVVSSLILLALPQLATKRNPQLPPNIVIILVDDLGQRDIEPYGSTFYETPNLAKLAKQGAVFTDAYSACPVCSPTRASLLTGKYPQRTGITDYAGAITDPKAWKANTKNLPAPTSARLETSFTTIAELVKAKGYRTFFAGKWHVGGEGFGPLDQGFDINKGGSERGGPYTGNKYFSPYDNTTLPDGPVGEQIDNRLGMETARFIRENKDKPFFAMCATFGVHTPLMAKPNLLAKYREKRKQLQLIDRWIQDGFREVRQTQDEPVYAGMVEAVDESVGLIMESLLECDLERDTLLIFTSDNGGLSTSEGWPTSNLPNRGGKGWMYEGGIRVPLIIRWPGVTKANSLVKTPAISFDFFPTVAAILNDKPALQSSDGVDLKAILQGKQSRTRDIFWAYPHYGNQGGEPASAVRRGNWKLIEFEEDGRTELYDLAKDPGEMNDLAKSQPKVLDQLKASLITWRRKVGAKSSTPNPAFDPAKASGRISTRNPNRG